MNPRIFKAVHSNSAFFTVASILMAFLTVAFIFSGFSYNFASILLASIEWKKMSGMVEFHQRDTKGTVKV